MLKGILATVVVALVLAASADASGGRWIREAIDELRAAVSSLVETDAAHEERLAALEATVADHERRVVALVRAYDRLVFRVRCLERRARFVRPVANPPGKPWWVRCNRGVVIRPR